MKCCICKKYYEGNATNPIPVKVRGRCCDTCNITLVIPLRIKKSTKKTI